MGEERGGGRRLGRRAALADDRDRREAAWLEAGEGEGGDDLSATRPRRTRRRTVSRLILAATFALGVLSLLVMLVPYDVAVAGGDPARCGPPFFELVVPPDPRFDVVERDLCPSAARSRVVLGAVGLAAAVVVAGITERRVRHRTSAAHAAWLAKQRRPRRKERRRRTAGGGPAEAGATGADDGPMPGDLPAASAATRP